MLLKTNNRIINTDCIIDAQFSGEGTKSVLVILTVDNGDRNTPAASAIILYGQEANSVWKFLLKESESVI